MTAVAEIGHNIGSGLDALRSELTQFEEDCTRIAKDDVTPETEGIVADLVKEELRLRQTLGKMKDEQKRPHLDANTAIEAAFKPLLARAADALAKPRARLRAWILAEEDKRKKEAAEAARKAEEARRIAEEIQRRAEAKEIAPDPFATFDAEQAAEKAAEAQKVAQTRVNVAPASGGRAFGLKSYWIISAVTDGPALVNFFANRSEVIEAARSVAAGLVRLAKSNPGIPGIVVKEDRR